MSVYSHVEDGHVAIRRRTWQLEGEVQRSEQDGEEDPPATEVHEETQSASSNLVCSRSGRVALSKVPVSGSEQTESGDKAGEDQDEDHISAERTNHVDEAEKSHPEEDEACKNE